MGLDVGEIVHLHEVQALDAELPQGLLHLADPGLPSGRPDLGRDEQLLARAELCREPPRHRFRGSVHGRAVDDAPTLLDEDPERLSGQRHRAVVAGHVEHLPGAEADGGDRLARPGDAPLEHRVAWIRS